MQVKCDGLFDWTDLANYMLSDLLSFCSQMHFYGSLPWAVILRVTLPLAIFHRFHSTVVLAEVWKASYRAHHE